MNILLPPFGYGLQAIANEMAPGITKHSDNVNLNKKLFARVNIIWESREGLSKRRLSERKSWSGEGQTTPWTCRLISVELNLALMPC